MRFLAAGLLLIAAACQYGDGAYAQRQARREHERRVASMKAATAEQKRGRPVTGDELVALLSGRTHVFEYESDPLGRKGRYVEYDYFRPDGRFVFLHTLLPRDPEGTPEDHWRVEGPRVCIVNTWLTTRERCFEIALLPNGRIQYFISSPGEDSDGLLTKVTDSIQTGPPQL